MSNPNAPTMHVSVTGFQLRHPWLAPVFWAHALRAMGQARSAPGNLHAAARTEDGIHHTLTAWTDRAAMRAYLGSGPHLAAMRAFPWLGSGRTCGFDAAEVPDWPTALQIWRATSREVPVPGHRGQTLSK
jgi:hypothetical protein